MPLQAAVDVGTNSDLYEELDPPENQGNGEFKTRNPEHDKFQRQFIHLSPEKSPFKKTIQMVLCVHGWEDLSHQQPMSLLVVRFHFTCNTDGALYRSVRIWFKFNEFEPADLDATSSTKSTATGSPGDTISANASPVVVAYAPFVKTRRWNESEAERRRTNAAEGVLGVNQMANAELRLRHERETLYRQRFFDKGTSDPIIIDAIGEVMGVEWYLEQNASQGFGVEPDFHVAMLLKRSNDSSGNPVRFKSTCDVRLDAGFQHNFEQRVRRIFRLGKPEDESYYYDPNRLDDFRGADGTRIMQNIDTDNLGRLAEQDMLVGLLGDAPGLQPMEPL